MFWLRYRGRCPGRLKHFIHQYCGLSIADSVIFKEGMIELKGESFATYEWDESSDVPTFTFWGKSGAIFSECQEELKEWLVSRDVIKIPDKDAKEFFESLAVNRPVDLDEILSWHWLPYSTLALAARASWHTQGRLCATNLVNLLKTHESPLVRAGAAYGLGRYIDGFITEVTLEEAANSDSDPWVRLAANNALEPLRHG